jgi:hypothetical protein
MSGRASTGLAGTCLASSYHQAKTGQVQVGWPEALNTSNQLSYESTLGILTFSGQKVKVALLPDR